MIEYQYASNKGGISQGEPFADPFGFYHKKGFENFTGATVVETATEAGTTKWNAAGCFAKNDKGEVEFVKDHVLMSDGTTKAVADIAVGDEFTYVYNNIVIPQNDLPMVKAEMKSIALVAKARRIAVYYSQIAAYQAKTDYGVDLGDQLAEKAVGELAYEIDTEITNLLHDEAIDGGEELVWSKTLPVGVNSSKFSLLRCA